MSLEEDLQYALDSASAGEPLGPSLYNSIRMAAGRVLRQHGYRGARVDLRREGRGVVVDIRLPPGVPRAQRIVLRMG